MSTQLLFFCFFFAPYFLMFCVDHRLMVIMVLWNIFPYNFFFLFWILWWLVRCCAHCSCYCTFTCILFVLHLDKRFRKSINNFLFWSALFYFIYLIFSFFLFFSVPIIFASYYRRVLKWTDAMHLICTQHKTFYMI